MRWNVVIFLLFFVGCSVATLAIKNLDWIISRQVKNHLDLYYNQEKSLQTDISHFLTRQKIQVDPLTQLIKEITLKYESKIQLKDVIQIRSKLSDFYTKIADDFNSNILSKYLAQISQKQLAHFRNENTKRNIELKEKISNNESTIFKRIEFFVGDFTAEQKQIIVELRPPMQSLQKQRLQRRKELQIKLYQVLASSKTDKKQEIQKLFYNYVHKSDLDKDQKQKQNYNKNFAAIDEGIVKIFNSLNQNQKKALAKKIQWLTDSLKSFKETNF